MIEVFDHPQGSEEWFRVRMGLPTASRFATVMAKGQGKTRSEYMRKLAGEIVTGEPMDAFSNHHTERGHELEPQAREMYAFMHDAEPEIIGFIRNGGKGGSPDSLIGTDGVLEIKTKLAHIQIDCLLADKLPPEHKAQGQGILWVAEREWIDFVSYWPTLPLFVTREYRDEEYIAKLASAVDEFNDELAHMVERIRAMGGDRTMLRNQLAGSLEAA